MSSIVGVGFLSDADLDIWAKIRAFTNLPEGQEWLESPRQKILSGKAVKNSKEPVWPGNFSPTEPDKIHICKKMS